MPVAPHGYRRQATGDRRQATGDRRQATGDRRQAAYMSYIQFPPRSPCPAHMWRWYSMSGAVRNDPYACPKHRPWRQCICHVLSAGGSDIRQEPA
ncbi:hypothetical protein CFR75_04810 [Komagataeibacter xylinus]|uniref:Uncharacterized protein n=1 Tax=Komagataeibacter xylinus TaxID=28448 RepID=A0A318PVX9_KOMXY|nr:hypothetical protein CFR75_04810 [Komagataeibacter xylinus]